MMSASGQQRRSKAARTLVRSTPKNRHADRQRILRLGANKRLMHRSKMTRHAASVAAPRDYA